MRIPGFPPQKFSVKSNGGSKQVLSTPNWKGGVTLVVSDTTRGAKKLWTVRTSNTPIELFVSNNGSNVVTCNTWGNVGYGDYVVAIYSQAGELARYSLESFAPPPEQVEQNRNRPYSDYDKYRAFFGHSTSSRWWDRDATKLIYSTGHESFFCVWLPWREQWTTVDLTTGTIKSFTAAQLENLIAEAASRARLVLASVDHPQRDHRSALRFLTFLHQPDDRSLLLKALRSKSFYTSLHTYGSKIPIVVASSSLREAADALLSKWDGKEKRDPSRHRLYADDYMFAEPMNSGAIDGIIHFKKRVRSQGSLHIYLLPLNESATVDGQEIEHSFFVDLSEDWANFKSNAEFGIDLKYITPGDYRLKVILDAARPYASTNVPPYKPTSGDYVSNETPISVLAGKTTEVEIDCSAPER